MVALLDTDWSQLLSEDPDVLHQVLTQLPSAVLTEHPRWASARQYVERMAADASATVQFRDAAVAPPRGLLDALASATAHAAGARARGDFEDAVAQVRAARDLLDEATPAARRALSEALPELTYQWAMTWEFAGDVDTAAREYVEAYDHAALAGNTATEALAAGSLAWVHALSGRRDAADEWLARTPETAGHAWDERVQVVIGLTRALLALDELRPDQAIEHLNRIEPAALAERWPLRQLIITLAGRSPEEAVAAAVELEAYAATRPAPLSQAGLPGAAFVLARAASAAAARNAGAAKAAIPAREQPVAAFAAALADIVRATFALRIGDRRGAARIAAIVRTHAGGSPRLMVSALSLQASVTLDEDPDAATTAYRAAAHLARTERLFFQFGALPPADLARLADLAPETLPADVLGPLLERGVPSDPDPLRTLTPGERRVFEHLMARRSTAEIARELVISPNTVKTQTRNIYRRVGVRSRLELETLARRHGHIV